ncbi:MAG: hypothetical protein G01um101430_224 [Parcubacteria group bacterium Gr01-1014_30]|nr:MAG: hypothetical protein G01um101430_224 [Parcubacteria group bacterium Gr01-1014_30]
MNLKRLEVFLEFLCFGIIIGVIEDIVAIKAVTDAAITWRVFGIIVLIAVPFAFLGEVVVDRIDFVAILGKLFKNKELKK